MSAGGASHDTPSSCASNCRAAGGAWLSGADSSTSMASSAAGDARAGAGGSLAAAAAAACASVSCPSDTSSAVSKTWTFTASARATSISSSLTAAASLAAASAAAADGRWLSVLDAVPFWLPTAPERASSAVFEGMSTSPAALRSDGTECERLAPVNDSMLPLLPRSRHDNFFAWLKDTDLRNASRKRSRLLVVFSSSGMSTSKPSSSSSPLASQSKEKEGAVNMSCTFSKSALWLEVTVIFACFSATCERKSWRHSLLSVFVTSLRDCTLNLSSGVPSSSSFSSPECCARLVEYARDQRQVFCATCTLLLLTTPRFDSPLLTARSSNAFTNSHFRYAASPLSSLSIVSSPRSLFSLTFCAIL
mmetsp:Transcript_20508/g.38426  ORF Transcript_20508/g.38426 Transcript_20508/m.38426 type:complete len:363 (+) Transcript_20508:353-1441(+)